MNYQISDNLFIATVSIFESFQNSCTDKEIVNLTASVLGIIINQLFPSAVRTQNRVNGKRVWHYSLARVGKIVDIESNRIKWENLGNLTLDFGWHLSNRNDNFVEWIKIPSQDLCNSNRVLKEVKIFKDWTFVVRVNNCAIKKKIISYLFCVLDEFAICKGFSVDSKIITRDIKENVNGITEQWHIPANGSGAVENATDSFYSTLLYCM
jgi:hypothetical protein